MMWATAASLTYSLLFCCVNRVGGKWMFKAKAFLVTFFNGNKSSKKIKSFIEYLGDFIEQLIQS